MIGLPELSFPRKSGIAIFLFGAAVAAASAISLRKTVSRNRFGISTPSADLPFTCAMRTRPTPSDMPRSSASPVTREILVPRARFRS